MNILLLIGIILILLIGAAHSYLGERYILIRLFRRADLPHLFGSDVFTRQTLRFGWHLATIAWVGLGAILAIVAFADPEIHMNLIVRVIGVTFLLTSLLTFSATRGKHLAWIVFLAIAIASFLAACAVVSGSPI